MAGDDIVASGPDIEGCPDDPSLAEIGRRTGRLPFLFTRILVSDPQAPDPAAKGASEAGIAIAEEIGGGPAS
jgi:hypothetical protein